MHRENLFLRYRLHHALFWMLVFGIWYFLRYQDYTTTAMAIQVTMVKVFDLALLVYLTNYLLIPKLLYKRKYIWFTLAFVVMIVTSSIIKMQIIGQLVNNPGLFDLSNNLKTRIYDNIIPHFFLVIAGATVKLVSDHTRMQQRMAAMAKEKAEAELQFLKSQINPHFVFNSLNSIYFLIDKNNITARESLHKFSDMLRYQLYELKGEKISIEKEIAYLNDYVDMQKLRRDEKYEVSINSDPDVKGFSIEPLLLVPFVENSFKHLSNYTNGRKNEVKINISRSNGEMKFSIGNTTEGKQVHQLKDGGIGLANVKRRLELLYPGSHRLEIKEENGWFDVELKITIER